MKSSHKLAFLSLLLISGRFFGQTDLQLNTITTAVPFLQIAPDSRGGGIGDAGVATSPDANSIHWNPSKLAFIENESGLAVSFTPWLRGLNITDIYLGYVSGYRRLNDQYVVGASLKYFALGDITFTNFLGQEIGQFNPNEFSFDVAFAAKLSRRFSGGTALRYIRSDLTNGINDTKAGNSVAMDVSGLYRNDDMEVGGRDAELNVGINISNIGAKMSYSQSANKDFIPINLRIGQAFTMHLDDYNSLTFITDFNKLLVPTPPIYARDSSGSPISDGNGGFVIESGKDPNVGVASGMFNSFSDAPGGFQEELREINFSVGMEYWYDQLLAFRAGYFYEHPTKGDRQFWTIGFGLKMSVFAIDASYLIAKQNNPLANTLRFTLYFNFDDFGDQNQDVEE